MSLADELHALEERSANLSEATYQEAFLKIISVDIAKMYTKHMGYEFSDERLQRIAKEALFARSEGVPAPYAFSHALSLELALYGDPNDKTEYVGLLGTSIGESEI